MRINTTWLYTIIAISALLCVTLIIVIIRICVRMRRVQTFRMNGSQDKLTNMPYLPASHSSDASSPIYINTGDIDERKAILYKTSLGGSSHQSSLGMSSPRTRVVSGENGKETVYMLNSTPDCTVEGRNDS